MKFVLILTMLASLPVFAVSNNRVFCDENGTPKLKVSVMLRGCAVPAGAYVYYLDIDEFAGTVSVKARVSTTQPHQCDNPRGYSHSTDVVIPMPFGTWTVETGNDEYELNYSPWNCDVK